jgi:hypothetical protein
LKISNDLIKIDSVVDGFPGKDAFPNTVTAINKDGSGGFIATGSTTYVVRQSSSLSTAMHLRFTDDLEIYNGVWDRLYYTSTQNSGVSDFAVRTVQLDNNRFYIFGYTNGFGPPNFDIWYYPLNDGASSADNNSISFASTDVLSDVSGSTDLAFGSISTAESSGSKDLIFSRFPIYSKVENNQELIKRLGKPINTTLSAGSSRNFESTKIVSKLSGEGYFVIANEIELDNSRNIWISSMDEAGNVLWSSAFGAKENDDRAGGVGEMPNGRVMVLGTMHLENQDKLVLINLSNKGKLSN